MTLFVNANPYFETDASAWSAFGGSKVRSTAQAHEGSASLLLTPDGVSATARVESDAVTGATAGSLYRAQAWVRCAASRNVDISINWWDAGGAYFATSSTGGTYAVTANTWTKVTIEATAPVGTGRISANVGMSGTPSGATLLYVDEAGPRPAISLTVTPQPGNVPPRVLLELEYAGQSSATIVRNDPDGSQTPVRLAEPATLDGTGVWVGYDYESWFGSSTTYTATTAGGSITSAAMTLSVTDVWLRHPGIPSLSQLVDFQGEGDPVRPVVQSVLEPLGRINPIVVSDGQRKSKRGDLTLRTKNDTEHAGLLGLVDDVTPLLLDVPPGNGYGADLTHQYLSIGDLTQTRLRPDYYPHPWRIWRAPYTVVGRPAGGIQSQRTYADLLAGYATYQAVLTRYPTYTNVLTGV